MQRLAIACVIVLSAGPVHAQTDSIWARRDPKLGYLFQDYRARQVGDVLTIVVNEITEFEGQEKREMQKQTQTGTTLSFKGNTSAGAALARKFTADFEGDVGSNRKFDGKANSTIDRKFTDRMSVVVVGVMPNGNLMIEGVRQRVVSREVRMLRVTGIVRPADIGPNNTVQSQYIGNFSVFYEGRGPDTNYTNQGWGGRIFNAIWPF